MKHRSSIVVGLGSTRSLSFWGSAPSPIPVPPPTPVTQETIETDSQSELVAAATPTPEPTSVSEVVTSLDVPSTFEVPPLNYGDLAALGFSHWTPAGIAQWSMELIQVTSGMPWFWTIVTVTILSRLIVIPFNINSLRTTAKLAPHQPRLMELRNELQQIGGLSKDPIAVQRISLQQKQIYGEAGVSVVAPLVTPLVQLPVSLGLFFGIKKLCEFPLEQLKVGGFSWITDLTVPDPTYLLPLAMAVLINAQLAVSDYFVYAPSSSPLISTYRLVQRISPAILVRLSIYSICSKPLRSFLFRSWLTSLRYVPSSLSNSNPLTPTYLVRQGVLVYLLTTVIATTAQSLLLRVPSIRKALNIPRIPSHLRVKPPTFLETVKFGVDWFKGKSAEAQAQARAQQRKKL